ncbi:hypothetical protein ACFY8P_18495 [Streptomyces sp. NPDC012693]|uniref:hypothetical protein n=1 Tax=Streptomyces sp. NPDC012693 TaxID=3364844 RepID=UPI0036C33EC3
MSVRLARPLAAAAAALTLSGVALAGAPAAFAAPGDNGDVKIHHAGRPDEPPRTPEADQRNEPRVCTFYISALGFDGLQLLNWTISPQPPKGGAVRVGSITVDPAGNGYTPDIELPDGMYKVEWTWTGQQGAKKSKVFRVDCDHFDGPPNGNGGNGNGGNGDGGNGHHGNNGNNNGWNGGNGQHKPPHGPVGAGGGGSAEIAAEDSSTFGVGAAVAAGLAGTAGLVLIRRSRRRNDGAA